MEEKPEEEVERVATAEPSYANELSIYQKGMIEKLEEFRMARADWLAHKDENQKSSTNINVNLNQSNIYKGRCICLRKLRVNTTYLRTHYKTVRPFRYWTLKKRITDLDVMEAKIERAKRGLKRTLSPESCESGRFWTKQSIEECERQALAVKGRKAQRRKRRECQENKPSGPCKKAIKKLKASKVRDGLLESCKCDDGREVTLVIKGICLCDKRSLNNLDLNKVCDEYNKRATGIAIQPSETKPLGNVDPTAPIDPTKEPVPEIIQPLPPPVEETVDDFEPSKLIRNDSVDIVKRGIVKSEEADETKVFEVTERENREENEGEKSEPIENNKAERLEDEKSEQLEDEKSEQLEDKKSEQHEDKKSEQLEDETSEQIEEERSERIEGERSEQTEDENSELSDDERTEKLDSIEEIRRRIGFHNENELKGDGQRRLRPLTDSEITVFRRFSSSSLEPSSSDTNVHKASSVEDLHKYVRQQTMPQLSKSVKIPQSDSLNNLLIPEDSSRLPTKTGKKSSLMSHLGQTNSIEIHKKNFTQKNLLNNKETKENNLVEARKTKVRLSDTPNFIPNKVRHPTKTEGKEIVTQKKPAKDVLEKVHPPQSMRNQLVRQVREVNTDKEKVQHKPIEKKEMKASASRMSRKFSGFQDENASIVTLYENKPADKSEMGLTKEERNVMKLEKDVKEDVKTDKPAESKSNKFK